MALRLPQDGYSAMVFINNLTNAGHIKGVGYNIKKLPGGSHILVSITAHIGTKLFVEKPPSIIMPGGMVKVGGNGHKP